MPIRPLSQQQPWLSAYDVRPKSEPLTQHAASTGTKILNSVREASWDGYSGDLADPDAMFVPSRGGEVPTGSRNFSRDPVSHAA